MALQKKYLGEWVTRQKKTVETYGDFPATRYGRYSGTYQVRATGANNIIKTTYRVY